MNLVQIFGFITNKYVTMHGHMYIKCLSRASAAHSNSRCNAELSFLEFSFLSSILGGCLSDWLPVRERERATILDFYCVGGQY